MENPHALMHRLNYMPSSSAAGSGSGPNGPGVLGHEFGGTAQEISRGLEQPGGVVDLALKSFDITKAFSAMQLESLSIGGTISPPSIASSIGLQGLAFKAAGKGRRP